MQYPDIKTSSKEKFHFISGGGEMGELIRAKDWSKTPLGDSQYWPQSLRTMVAVMLENPFGMYIAWSREYIQLYNDGYRPILGSIKHPGALGISTRETFAEIWHIVQPMFDSVMEGEAFNRPDFMYQLNRNGFIEDCYFDFSYSPIRKEDGEVGGVLVTVIETTNKRKAQDELKKSEERFRTMADNIPNLAWMAKADGWIYWYNKKWYEYTGTTPEQMEGWGWQSVHDPNELPLVVDEWKKSIASGQSLEMIFPIKGADGKFRKFLTRILPVKNSDGKIYQWFGSNTDITFQVEAEEALKESAQRFRDTVRQAPVGMVILSGREFVVEMANNAYLLLVDKEENEFVGKPLFDSLPEVEQSVHAILDNVLDTGIPYHGIEYPISINRHGRLEISYFDFLYHPLTEQDGKISGIIVTITDVSSQVLARTKLEEIASIVHSSDDAIISKNLNGIITSWNTAAERIFGYSGEEMIGQPISKLIPADRINEEPDILARLRKGQRVDHFETKRVTKDQRILDISLTISPVRDSDGNVIGASKIARDITRQKQAERIIKESEEKFRLLADSMPQFVWTGDAEGNLNYFNKAVYTYSGLTKEQFEKGGWLQIVHPDERNENIIAWQRSVTKGQDFLFEHRFRRDDGEYRWQLSRAVPQRDEAGKIQMWVGTSTDIQEMKEEDQQKDYFIGVASHELKTPITSIKAYTQLLQNTYSDSNDPFLTKSLNTIEKQVLKLTNLISDLLDLSKIKSGRLTLKKENFLINELIHEVIDEIKHINPTYEIIFSKEAMATLHADRERIGQVIINFLTNAIKYSPNSDKIEVESLAENNNLTVTVRDYGIGINKNDQEKIFERFYRVEGKDEKKFPGFGIGLFISMEIIRRHQGTIGVNSEPGKGSVFYFSIPLSTDI
jgi:PAS domain S-box-containing protein